MDPRFREDDNGVRSLDFARDDDRPCSKLKVRRDLPTRINLSKTVDDS